MEFLPFPKLARLNREIVITEKLDGTNAQIYIDIAGQAHHDAALELARKDNYALFAGSRTKWITPGKQSDNAGFAAWVQANAEELFQLGPGQHFGEWWGQKIQRGYGLTEKRFSLFNVGRWAKRTDWESPKLQEGQQYVPYCCDVVPVLYQGLFSEQIIRSYLNDLQIRGSQAAPGFMKPEGIVIYHTAANRMFKVTLEGDEKPKGMR